MLCNGLGVAAEAELVLWVEGAREAREARDVGDKGRPSARQKTGTSPAAMSARRVGPAERPAQLQSGQNPTNCSEDEYGGPSEAKEGRFPVVHKIE